MSAIVLSERERNVLEAVIRSYVETAEPAGSRSVARRFGLGVSAATVRNTMADLEEKGFLFHPHTSAGRIPTDLAYRYYVDTLMRPVRLSPTEQRLLRRELADTDDAGELERLVRRAAQALGLLTGDLGLAVVPRLAEAVLEKLELISLSSEKVLLILSLRTGAVRTVYVDLPSLVPAETLLSLTRVLNERLAGQTLSEIRQTLPERLRDSEPTTDDSTKQLLNIFLQSAEEAFDMQDRGVDEVHLGRASLLASQPEFAEGAKLRSLMELTERRDILANVLNQRPHEATLKITIGAEHSLPELQTFTLVTSEYTLGSLSGVLGVIGPTRMPYEKVAAIVETTSTLLSGLRLR